MYKLIDKKHYSNEHITYIDEFRRMINYLSANTDIIMGAKDINSCHIISTNEYAKIVGLKKGNEVIDRMDKEMPCEGTAQYAETFIAEDKSLIDTLDVRKGISVLNIHNYSDGTKARIFKKYMFKHEPSQSILGTIYTGYDINLTDVLNIVPNYITRFGATGSIESINHNYRIYENIKLTNYEQEICFLLILNWDFKQIASFMNIFRPEKKGITADTVIKKKNYLCNKFGLRSTLVSELRDFLVSINFHSKMPVSFYNTIIGSSPLRKISINF